MVSYDLLLFMFKIKLKPRPEKQIPCHFSDGIICGLKKVGNHLRFGIISGLGIICGRGSFAALYRSISELHNDAFIVKICLGYNSKQMTSEADFFFFGGNIITMDENNPSAEALAVKGDKIQAVGKFDEVLALTGPTTEFIYLNHQTLLPGFIEPHQHAIMMVTNRAVGTIQSCNMAIQLKNP